jgi:hypothetical protein
MKAYFRSVRSEQVQGRRCCGAATKSKALFGWNPVVAVAVTMYQTGLAAQQENFDCRLDVLIGKREACRRHQS